MNDGDELKLLRTSKYYKEGIVTPNQKYCKNSNDLESTIETANPKKKNITITETKSDSYYRRKRVLERLIFNTSNICNMNCSCCYASGGNYDKKGGVMSEDTCKRAIDKLYNLYDEIKIIQFFTGNSLMHIDIIKKVYQYVKDKYTKHEIDCMPRLGICTCDTLSEDDVMELIQKCKIGVTVVISGNPFIHNDNRYYSNCDETYEYIMSNFYKLHRRTSKPFTTEITFNRVHVDNDIRIRDIIDYFSRDFPKRKPATYSLVQRLVETLNQKQKSDYIYNAGLGTISVDINGNIYPCFMFTGNEDYCIGNVTDESVRLNDRIRR